MAHAKPAVFRPAKVAVVTVSDTRNLETDRSGEAIITSLTDAGHEVVQRDIIKDEYLQIRDHVQTLLDQGRCSFIILTGGTGLSKRDVTPEALAPLYTKRIPGFGEIFRIFSLEDVGLASMQSRAEAGLCGETIVFALPGSTGACRLAMSRIILPQLDPTHKPCNFRSLVPDPS